MSYHVAPLDLEQFGTEEDTDKPIEHDVWGYWATHGYPVDEIREACSVVHEKVNEDDTSHIVLKVQTLEKPIDEADIIEDETSIWCCDCKGYQHHYGVDLESESLTEWDSCPHIRECNKAAKAKHDKNQETLD